jgi:hypothetical protein
VTDRRRDPRTDRRFSLQNLLTLRSAGNGLALAVVGTRSGVLMAGSREDGAAQRAIAHAARELHTETRFTTHGARTGGRLSGRRLIVDDEPVVLAVMDQDRRPLDGVLDEMAERVSAILRRGAIARAA